MLSGWRKLFPNMTFEPRVGPHGYPLDLNGSLAYTRPKTGMDFWPTHSNRDNFAKLGYLQPMWPEFNVLVWAQAYGKVPFGPVMNPLPASINSSINVPALAKVGNAS